MSLTSFGFPMETVVVFTVLFTSALALERWVHRHYREILPKQALCWSVFWVAVAILFGIYCGWRYGHDTAMAFFSGYTLWQILSLDNVVVMMAIFAWFQIPTSLHYRVLRRGVAVTALFQIIFVLVGAMFLNMGMMVEILFMLAIAASGYFKLKNNQIDANDEDYSEHFGYAWMQRLFPVFPRLYQNYFFLKNDTLRQAQATYPDVKLIGKNATNLNSTIKKIQQNQLVATPLLVCLAVIELSNMMLSLDSMPAVLVISRDPWLAYMAAMLAIMNVRTLYFALIAFKQYSAMMEKVAVILLYFVAFKLLFSLSNQIFYHGWEISATSFLVVMLLVMAYNIAITFVAKKQ